MASLYEGDTILLSCPEARGFVYSLPPCSRYSTLSVYPDDEEINPNVHCIAFQVLPEYAQEKLVSPLLVTKPEDRNYLHRELVYGRKIKLLHLASGKYLNFSQTETKPAILDEKPCLFKMLSPPSSINKSRGDPIHSGDSLVLEVVVNKEHRHVLCVKNIITNRFELKMAVTSSLFIAHSQTVSDETLSPTAIRGGSVVRFYDITNGSYLCGQGSTVSSVVLEDGKDEVYAKKKRTLQVPRPPPVSGDCWWQLEKSDKPLDGNGFKYNDRCRLRHIPTLKYLAHDDSNEFTLGSISELETKKLHYNFFVKTALDDNVTGDILKGSAVRIAMSIADDCQYLCCDDRECSWPRKNFEKKSSGTKSFKISLSVAGSAFKIDEVKAKHIHDLYYVESVKDVLDKYLSKQKSGVALVELESTLNDLMRKLRNSPPQNLRIYIKMLCNSKVIDVLVSYLELDPQDRTQSLLKLICQTLKEIVNVRSRRSKCYIAKRSFMNIYFKKLGKGLGVEALLIKLVNDESDIAKNVVEHFGDKLKDSSWNFSQHLDVRTLKLLSVLCYTEDCPEKKFQDSILKLVMENMDSFYWTKIGNDVNAIQNGNQVVYFLKTNDEENKTNLCSAAASTCEGFSFFVAQVSLLSHICKGVNETAIATVTKWFPIDQALIVLKDPNVHSLAKAAYLELVTSLYLDEIIQNSGVDIDGIWHCFLWEKLNHKNKEPLYGTNVTPNLLTSVKKQFKNHEKVSELWVIIESELSKESNLRLSETQEYFNQMLAVVELIANYGYCWNVGQATKYISIDTIVDILEKIETEYKDVANSDCHEPNPGYRLLMIKALKVIDIFFKQFIYLALEKFLYFFSECNNQEFLWHFLLNDNAPELTSDQTSQFCKQLSNMYEFDEYKYFDVTTEQKLVKILRRLMNCKFDDLKSSAATLLYCIYDKEHIMFNKAGVSYIAAKSTETVYADIIKYSTFNDNKKAFFLLSQGIAKENDLKLVIEGLCIAMMIEKDETEPNKSTQDIAFSSSLCKILLDYVNKYCKKHDESQREILKWSCSLLQRVCRKNQEIQTHIRNACKNFKRTTIAVSSVARLLTEVFTNNYCEVTEAYLEELYTVACTFNSGDMYQTKDGPGCLEFLTVLEAIMKPYKATKAAFEMHQQYIIKLYHANYADQFGEIVMKDDDASALSTRRIIVLKKSPNDDFELLKLLHVTSLLATCCVGRVKPVEVRIRDIFPLKELVGIITSDIPAIVRKIPFARLLVGAYLDTETDSITSVHQISEYDDFWKHIENITTAISKIDLKDEEKGIRMKIYIKKVFEYYETWNEVFNPQFIDDDTEIEEKERKDMFTLRYFVEGLGPLVKTFCNALALLKNDKLAEEEYSIMIEKKSLGTEVTNKEVLSDLGKNLKKLLVKYKKILITTQDQCNFWRDTLESIDNALPVRTIYHCVTDDYKDSDSEEVIKYKTELKDQLKLMKNYKHFIKRCRTIYELKPPSSIVPCRDLLCSEELMPRGASFAMLIEFFSNDSTPDLLEKFLNVIYYQAQSTAAIESTHFTAMRTFQIIFGIFYHKMKLMDQRCWDKKVAEKVQNDFIDKKYQELILKQLTRDNIPLSLPILGILWALVYNENKTAQDAIYVIISEDPVFFLTIHKLISVLLQYNDQTKEFLTIESNETQLKKQELSQFHHQGETHIVFEQQEQPDAELSDDLLPMIQDTSFLESPNVTKESAVKSAVESAVDLDDGALTRAGIALTLISGLCDGQNRKLQAIMKKQEQLLTSVNVISGVAALMQTLVEAKQSDPVIDTLMKTIQCLIDMCAGNFSNQHMALNGQVVDSINDILSLSDTSVIKVQCKAIDLLEIIIEETSKDSSFIIDAVSKDLNINVVTTFIIRIHQRINFERESKEMLEHGMYKAYHVLRSLAEHTHTEFTKFVELKEFNEEDEKLFNELDEGTYRIEINYVTKEKDKILRSVYFPFQEQRTLNDNEKSEMQDKLSRDSQKDRNKDLMKWTKSVYKSDEHKRRLQKFYIWKIATFFSTPRHQILFLLTIVLNLFILGSFKVPSLACDKSGNTSSEISSLLLIPYPWMCWSTYYYVLLYFFGFFHVILSLWMVVEYFVRGAPNFVIFIPFLPDRLYKNNEKCFHRFKVKQSYDCFEVSFLSFGLIYRIVFLWSSIGSLATFGYLYCLCLPYVFINFDVSHYVASALRKRYRQLLLMAFVILSVLFIYAVLSFAIMSNFFDPDEGHYCSTLWHCYITIIRVGLLDGLGSLPVKLTSNNEGNFNIFFWRSIIDLSFFVIVTIISLEVITAILVDTFSELRQKKDEAEKDQKEKCYVCGIASDKFEKNGKGFEEHYRNDHNIYNYIYFALHVKSMRSQDHNAAEKQVFDMIEKDDTSFYPRKAMILKKK
ncbi:PREDICTED: uncharacterized protein LOC109584207 [Amphimedon queenslandica]|uniref:RyR/IP3R Homology associated domain-containing protein n=2 Tax=Amphimedon queenslandica TaxID=400682 RepID=A0AAN0JEH0_AMPQE|nr:PREDICTED: uncharacterized protein LOC109584207 [Amphimedon queenslandica]|eukprot:XP_019855415.1 PREDICTED: uncharacterized protein LOC109584207 [Amphimedon queenslandica]